MQKILIIDSDRSSRHVVTSSLHGHHGFEVIEAIDGQTGLQLIETERPAVCFLDMFLPEHHGLELFRKIRALDHQLPVIFITGDKSSETAIEAMRAGAFDYLPKPLDLKQLRDLALSAAKARSLMDQPVALPANEIQPDSDQFIGNSTAMIEVFKDIGRVSAQNVTVLLRGESGSGKELVARALFNHSDRSDKTYVAVNCAAIPDDLLESELFGHEKGAFTGAETRRIGRFEQCDGGTIFLDEVGDMSPVIQGKVLRLLQEQTFERVGSNEQIETDVRIIAATNRPLEEMVQDGSFREDLLYRLNAFTIHLPPLRERREDIPLLLEYFLGRAKSEMDRPELTGLGPRALEALVNYDWPGNVRQLQSVVRQSLLNSVGTMIVESDVPEFVFEPLENELVEQEGDSDSGGSDPDGLAVKDGQHTSSTSEGRSSSRIESEDTPETVSTLDLTSTEHPGEASDHSFSLDQFIEQRLQANSNDLYSETIAEIEKRLFEKVLRYTEGNQSKTAEILGITRGKVRDRIDQYNIQLDRHVSIAEHPSES